MRLFLPILMLCCFCLEASFIEREKRDLSKVYEEITKKELTMVTSERFTTIN